MPKSNGAHAYDRDTDVGGEISILGLINGLIRQRRQVVVLTALLGAVAVAWVLLTPRRYTATSAIMPQHRRAESAIPALAAQLGIGLRAGDETESPDFYADLLQARSLLEGAVKRPYVVGGRSMPLADALEIRDGAPAWRLDQTVRALRSRLEVRVDRKTGVVHVAVTTGDPRLSAQVNRRLLELLGTFNVERRQSNASAERRFTENRMREAERELRQAEDQLQAFLQANRSYAASPQLLLERDRLMREVERRQELYATLSQSYEQARIEEVRNTPVLTVVDPPEAPVRPDSRGGARKVALGMLLGLVVGTLLALWRDAVAGPDTLSPEHEEFRRLRQELADDVRHPFQALRRRSRRHVPAR